MERPHCTPMHAPALATRQAPHTAFGGPRTAFGVPVPPFSITRRSLVDSTHAVPRPFHRCRADPRRDAFLRPRSSRGGLRVREPPAGLEARGGARRALGNGALGVDPAARRCSGAV